jgi:hypothetical protein
MNDRRLDSFDTLGNLNEDVSTATGAWNALREANNEGTLRAALDAGVFDDLLNKPEDRRPGACDPVEFPVFVAVQDYKTAVQAYETAVQDCNAAVRDYETAVRDYKTAVTTAKQEKEQSKIQELTAALSRSLSTTVVSTAATVVDKATAVHATAKTVIIILDSSAKLNNGSEHTRQSTPRQESSNGASRTAPRRTSTMTTEPFVFPKEVQQKQLPELFRRFGAYLGQLMASSEAANELEKLDITATVEAILSFSDNTTSLDDANRDTSVHTEKEKKVVQPVLAAILWKMMHLVGSIAGLKVGSPARNHVIRERCIAPSVAVNESDRIIDITLFKDGKWTSKLQEVFREFPIEVKCLNLVRENAVTLSGQSKDQLLGHLHKRLRWAFEFGNLGVDCTATGAVMTLAHVEIVQVCLVGMGSASADVIQKSSGKLPLFSKVAVQNLLRGQGNEALLDELFSIDAVEEPIPTGMDALFRILLCNSCDLFTPYWQEKASYRANDGTGTYALENRLGAGAFGTVYSLNGHPSMVVKAPHGSMFTKTIKNEIAVLSELNSVTTCVNVPLLQSRGDLAINVRGSEVMLPALATSPRGKPIDQLFTLLHEDNGRGILILLVAEGVRRALEFAHGKLWFHLDVRPSNIVVEFDNNRNATRAVLIDWGIASKQEVTGFRGSKLYAHDDILAKRTPDLWTPEAKHDYASLFYTLVVMQGKGHVPWGSYCNTRAADLGVYLAKRQEKAIAVCNACFPAVKAQMEELLVKMDVNNMDVDDA